MFDMHGDKDMHHSNSTKSKKAGSKRKSLANESIDAPLGEDPAVPFGPRKGQSHLGSRLRKNPPEVDNEEEETHVPTKRRRVAASNDYDIFKVFVDSILDKGVIDGLKEAKQSPQVENELPLKFRFEDEASVQPEKTEFEEMVEKLFAEMEFALKCGEIGSLESPLVSFCCVYFCTRCICEVLNVGF